MVDTATTAPYDVVPPFAPPVEEGEEGSSSVKKTTAAAAMLLLTSGQQTMIANLAGWICIVTGLLGVFRPYKGIELSYGGGTAQTKHEPLKLYFLDEHDKAHHDALPVLAYNIQYQSLPVIENGLVWLLMSYLGLEFLQANCIASIPWIFFAVWSLYHGIPKKLGRSNKAALTLLMLNVPRLISLGLQDETSQRFAVQMNIMFALVNGFVFCLAPSKVQSVYGLPAQEHDRVLFARRVLGNNLFALGVFGASILWFETTKVMAAGLSWSASLVGVLSLMNEAKKVGGNVKQVSIWLVVMVFFAYTLTYQPQHPLEEEVETVAVVTMPWWEMLYRLLTLKVT